MLKASLATSAAMALVLCAACEQQKDTQTATSQQQAQERQSAEYPTQVPPTPGEQAASEAANEIEQAVAPTAQITPKELAEGVSITDISNPEATLATASVKTSSGEALGEVRSVVVGPDGKANAVNVEVGGLLNVGERIVSIDANKFTYLKGRNILVASVAKSDIEKMPAAKQN
jgi:hypothetical protein